MTASNISLARENAFMLQILRNMAIINICINLTSTWASRASWVERGKSVMYKAPQAKYTGII